MPAVQKINLKFNKSLKNKIDIKELFREAAEDKAFPGGVLAVGTSKENLILESFGYHTYERKVKYTVKTIFDLASLTKVCATTPAVMKLFDEGKLKLTDKAVKYLPEMICNEKDSLQKKLKSEVTILHLLTHTAGYPCDNNVFKLEKSTVQQKWDFLLNTPLAYFPGKKYIYSDVSMLLLQQIVQKISGLKLDDFLYKYFYKPLGMNHTFFCPPEKYLNKITPTEFDLESGKPLQGIVHDENARSLNGLAGHAGLFSTADDLSNYAKMLLNYGSYNNVKLIKSTTVKKFIKPVNIIPFSSRALGWGNAFDPNYVIPKTHREENNFILPKARLYEEHLSSGGFYIDPEAIGHTGFTGTSIWLSFKYNIYTILLTNRVYPFRNYRPVENYRYWIQKINSAVWENLGFSDKNEITPYPKI